MVAEEDHAPTATAATADADPCPVQIIKTHDHKFDLDSDALDAIFSSDAVKDTKVVVVSVAGAFRKGKSFLLDFFIRFLECQGTAKWSDDEESALRGFSWRHGVERETTGIWMWNKPFLVEKDGEKVAVILMDTQGTFDMESTVRENATVFGLSTLVSSVQIYNLSQAIQEDDLQHLQLFSEYGSLARSGELGHDNTLAAFQTLIMLVRDWANVKDHPLGRQGGEDYLNRMLQMREGQHAELLSVREHIRSSFADLGAFLLPHPGLDIVEDPNYNGNLRDIRRQFIKHLDELMHWLFDPENLVVKRVNGDEITGLAFATYFKAYVEIYQAEVLPEPMTALRATAEANNLLAKEAAVEHYRVSMDELTAGAFVETKKFNARHAEIKHQAKDRFHATKKMGGEEFSVRFEELLDTSIEHLYKNYFELNVSKQKIAGMRTPLVVLGMLIFCYISSYITDLLYLTPIAYILSSFTSILIIMIFFWFWARIKGDHFPILIDCSQKIDSFADFLMGSVFTPLWHSLISQATEQLVMRQTSFRLPQPINPPTNSTSTAGASKPASTSGTSATKGSENKKNA